MKIQTREAGARPTAGPGNIQRTISPGNSALDCVALAGQTTGACITVESIPPGRVPSHTTPANTPGRDRREVLAGATSSAVPTPAWCFERPDEGVFGVRDQACQLDKIKFKTYKIENGAWIWTGQVDMDVLTYEYSDKSQPTWGNQLEVAGVTGYGDALRATIEGYATASGECTVASSDFPPQGLSPLTTWRIGTSFFNTTAVNSGDIGHCTTEWNVTFKTPGYDDAAVTWKRSNIRCDNAIPGPRRIGCVVPWHPSPVYYSMTDTPDLAKHVAQAQASGLPGGTPDAPLTRNTSQVVDDANRRLACGDAPSIPDKSCDEYPLASTNQGLYVSGGTRRTFDGCNFNLPRATGSPGVSVCMINARDNNVQGGLQSALYSVERVLDGDPYRVIVVP